MRVAPSLGALLLLAACRGEVPPRVEQVTPTSVRALSGGRVEVAVRVSGDCFERCSHDPTPTLELASGDPLPLDLRATVGRTAQGWYYISNPGQTCPFACTQPDPQACPGWTYVDPRLHTEAFPRQVDGKCPLLIGFVVQLAAAPTRPSGVTALRLRIPACGEELLAPFDLELVAAAPAPGICAVSTGERCTSDADCSTTVCADAMETCGAGTAAPATCEPRLLPGPAGVTCGCVQGICAWH